MGSNRIRREEVPKAAPGRRRTSSVGGYAVRDGAGSCCRSSAPNRRRMSDLLVRATGHRLVEQLASRALSRGRHERMVHVKRDEDGRITGASAGAGSEGDGEGQEQGGADAGVESALLHFSSPRPRRSRRSCGPASTGPSPESLVWLEGYPALLRWRRRTGSPGCTCPRGDRSRGHEGLSARAMGPPAAESPAGRGARGAAQDTPRRATGTGWCGSPERRFGRRSSPRSYRRAHGHLAPRQDAVWGREGGRG